MTLAVNKGTTPDKKRQLTIALGIYLIYTLLLLIANVLNYLGEKNGTLETMEPIAGILMGLLAIPVFCIALPLWLARKWGLEFSFWPRRKNWLLGVAIVVLYTFLVNQQSLNRLLTMDIPAFDFMMHFVGTTMFQVSYYPLFAVLLLPVIRRNFGLGAGLIATSVLFAVYHLGQFYYFPAGTTLRFQIILFASFLVGLLLYLWTENLILTMWAHNVGGSIELAVNGALFNQVSVLFVVAVIIVSGLFAYMIVYELRHRGRLYRTKWWLQTKIESQASE
jgi:membrane protease YdiL (CAAX protease family)